eukprot:TRINITY_DN12567_c0_g1_i1.p1 TRINITY_DN12567_c0_g1~~TRINITY_DN12567_c0_g1_i1.p1  ORF type:complete len:1374 (-),score=157.15 TRINITY_DN12567_c0_g1_i1:96-4217(-)
MRGDPNVSEVDVVCEKQLRSGGVASLSSKRPLMMRNAIVLLSITWLLLLAAMRKSMDVWAPEPQISFANTSSDSLGSTTPDVKEVPPFLPLRNIRIANGDFHLLPTFSPDVTNYNVRVSDDGTTRQRRGNETTIERHGDNLHERHMTDETPFRPVVKLEMHLDMRVMDSTCLARPPFEVIIAGDKVVYDQQSGLVQSRSILLHMPSCDRHAANRRMPYDLVVIEVHERNGSSTAKTERECAGKSSGGRVQFYTIRFHLSNKKFGRCHLGVEGREDTSSREFTVVARLPESERTHVVGDTSSFPAHSDVSVSKRRLMEDVEAEDSALQVLKTPDLTVSLKVLGGTCMFTHGPFAMPVKEGALDWDLSTLLWKRGSRLMMCFAAQNSQAVGGGLHLSAFTSWQGQLGEFGFGPDVTVSLRPNIASDLRWPFTVGIPSINLAGRDGALRLLSIETSYHHENQSVPLVVMSSRAQEGFDVRLLDPTIGSCARVSPDGAGGRVICRVKPKAQAPRRDCHAQFVGDVCASVPQMMTMSILATCESCAGRNLSIGVAERRLPGSNQPVGSKFKVPLETSSLWVGWTAELGPDSSPLQWRVVASSISGSRTHDFVDVALVLGSDPVTWLPTDEAVGVARLAGEAVRVMVLLTTLMLVVGHLLSCVGFQVANLAVLPATNAAALSLEFLVLMASRFDVPVLFLYFREPLDMLVPATPEGVLVYVSIFLLVVCSARCTAVIKCVIIGGTGVASNLPHSLCFGAWELRMLSLVALPLASSAWTCILNAPKFTMDTTSSYVYLLKLALVPIGGLIIICLSALALQSLRKVREAFRVEGVFCTKLPGSEYVIFVDRVCDQLRALPLRPRVPSVLGFWPETPSWLVAPHTATIHNLEHRCGPISDTPSSSWDTVWPTGPWGKPEVRHDEDKEMAMAPSEDSQPQDVVSSVRSISRDSGGADGRDIVRTWHPITAVATFTHQIRSQRVIVGVSCTPWIDVALSTNVVRTMTKHAGEARLKCNVSQLCGPLTTGRLSACFDWGTRWPFRWPCDLLLKVALGAYIAVVQRSSHGTHQLDLVDYLALGIVVAAFGVFYVQPYVHFVDNAALFLSLAVVFVTIVAMTPSFRLPLSETIVLTLLTSLACSPLAIAFTASLFAVSISVAAEMDDLHDEMLPRVILGWSYPQSAKGSQSKGGWGRLGDDPSSFAPAVSKVDVMLMTSHSTSNISDNLQIECPAEAWQQIVHIRLNSTPTPSGSIVHLPCGGDRARLPVGANIIFPSKPLRKSSGFLTTSSVRRLEGVAPLASLLTQTGGTLVYANPHHNDGLSWREVVRSFFSLNAMELVREIETIIAGEDDLPKDAEDAQKILYIIEVVGDAVPKVSNSRVITG